MKTYYRTFLFAYFLLINTIGATVWATIGHHYEPQEPCANWRWIAEKKTTGTECLTVPGWKNRDLFRLPKRWDNYNGELRNYCVYEAESKSSDIDKLKKYLSNDFELSQDCFVAVTLATDLEGEQRAPLQNFMDRQIDYQAVASTTTSSEALIRLSLLDTVPSYDGITDSWLDLPPERRLSISEHGYTLANIMNRLVCDENGNCDAQMVSNLALPIYSYDDSDPDRVVEYPFWGGYFGSIGHIGEAVMAALADWIDSPNPQKRLVLNISAGWDAEKHGGLNPLEEEMNIPLRSTFQALRLASCLGVITVAANGNTIGGLKPTKGALAPGLWEQIPRPNKEECLKLTQGFGDFEEPSYDAYLPMVYGTSGVAYGERVLANARPESLSRLVAYGDHATIVEPKGVFGAKSGVLTGSSVSTAVVAATAAKIWSYRPELPSFAIMDILYGLGYSLDKNAQTCLGGDSKVRCPIGLPVRRLSYCRAVAAVCPECVNIEACNSDFREPIDLSALPLNDFSEPASQVVDAARINQSVVMGIECQNAVVMYDLNAPMPAYPCPQWQVQSPEDAGWALPQPAGILCPNCTLKEPGSTDGETPEANAMALSTGVLSVGGISAKGVSNKLPLAQELAFAENLFKPNTLTNAGWELLIEVPDQLNYFFISNITLNLNGKIMHLNNLAPLYYGQSVLVKNITDTFVGNASITFLVNGLYAVTSPILVSRKQEEPVVPI